MYEKYLLRHKGLSAKFRHIHNWEKIEREKEVHTLIDLFDSHTSSSCHHADHISERKLVPKNSSWNRVNYL